MAFLTKEELKTVSTTELINKLTANDDSIIDDIIDESISLMKGYLSKYYDVELIFSTTGDNRHKTVLKKLKDIVIYEIYERHTREQNQVAKRRFDEAMLWLENLNKGEFYYRTLPAIPSTNDVANNSNDIRYGGYTRFTSKY